MKTVLISANRSRAAMLIAWLFILTTTTGAYASQEEAAPQVQSGVVEDPGWPREYIAEDGVLVTLHQPQVDSWEGHSSITFRTAVSFTPDSRSEPVYGALRIRADTDTDLENRTVLLGNMEVIESKLPSLDGAEEAAWETRIASILPKTPTPIDLDRLLAYFDSTYVEVVARDIGAGAPNVPLVFVSQEPAILVVLDGEPVLFPVEGTDLMFAVNTNWDLFFHSGTEDYYLLDRGSQSPDDLPRDGYWMTAPAVEGPWSGTADLPQDFERLPGVWEDLQEYLPEEAAVGGEGPLVFSATGPAELIVIHGEPAMTPIEGTGLLSVDNTESDLFLFNGDDHYYYLVSGRWFRASTLEGPWVIASADLPPDFAAIPPEHERSYVLASVPGTPESVEAVRLAQVPTKATVTRGEADIEVNYEGEPDFRPIEGTSMGYAANTASDVIRVGDLYYLCFQGAWFFSTSPNGPWDVADQVPEEIYTIPPSSPVHHTTYVYVYDHNPDWVTVGYTAPYTGSMIAVYGNYPVVVYGTGWYYPPYLYYGSYYPIYYPYHHSYGAAAWYNPSTGTYGRAASVYGPYGGAGRAAAYNPQTGTYARGGAAYGPYGGAAASQAYNPRTGAYREGYRASTPYESWGQGTVERGDQWARSGYYSDSRGDVAGVRTSEGNAALAVRNDQGAGVIGNQGQGVFVGQDGDVYRRNQDGWSRYEGDQWSQVERGESQRAGERGRANETPGQPIGPRRADSSFPEEFGRRSQPGAGEGQRSWERSRSGQASGSAAGPRRADRSSPQGFGGGSQAGRTPGDLNREARARADGSRRANEYRTQRSAPPTRSRPTGGRARGGRRGGD
jgi:hypothetical protein